MACTDKFTITKGVDNTFVFTIKQTGTTLPMEIVNNKINKKLSIVPAVTYVPYQAKVQPHYTADNTAISVDLASMVSGLSIVKIEVQPEVTIADLKVGAVSKPLVNSWYDIGTATAFTVTPVTVTGELSEPLPAILLRIRLTLTGTVDTFDAKLITLETGEIVLELGAIATVNGSKLTIKDATSGRIELLLTEADIAELIVDKGPKVDRYYARPSYKMVIECNTINNGEFLATIPYVYVE